MKNNTYTFIFAVIVCVVCSVLLAALAKGLRPRQELNAALEVKKNILKVVELQEPLSPKPSAREVLDAYGNKIQEVVIDSQGNIVEGKKPPDVQEGEPFYPLYIYQEGNQVMAYCYPISGKGLWSTLYGYLAMEPDGRTIRGITFYKHGETPGLGGEIEKDWFQENFKGKTIWDAEQKSLAPVVVVKGHVEDKLRGEAQNHAVDGITAATMTSNGVTALLDQGIRIYDPFFAKLRTGGN